jgi:8-oxo-dGTP pyrophosphatase MutT (NUDIX family)
VETLFVKQFMAVGGIIVSKTTNRVLTVMRSVKESYPGTWNFCGGKIEFNESPHEALVREIKEELGEVSINKLIPLHRYQSRSKDFIYDTYIVLVQDEFVPILNWENSGFAWTDITTLPMPLHPKTKKMLAGGKLINKFKTFCDWADTHAS